MRSGFPFALSLLGCFLLVAAGMVAPMMSSPSQIAQAQEPKAAEKLLRHVVMFKFKDSSTPEQIQGVVDAFRQLPEKISEIHDFEYGTNNSPEGLADGLTHCFLVTFTSEADRAKYLPHPEHQKFVEVLKPHLDRVVVIDYWSAK